MQSTSGPSQPSDFAPAISYHDLGVLVVAMFLGLSVLMIMMIAWTARQNAAARASRTARSNRRYNR